MHNPSKKPQEIFSEIMSLAIQAVVYYNLESYNTTDIKISVNARTIIEKNMPKIQNQVVFEIYYVLYLLCEEKHSLYHFIRNELISLGKGDLLTNIASESEYDMPKYAYEKFRKRQDEIAKQIYDIDNIGLYKLLKSEQVTEGHKIRLLDYYFLKRDVSLNNINYMLKVLRDNRLPNTNSVSATDFKEKFVKGIDELYQEIKTTDYTRFSTPYKNWFLRSIDFYQLEKNCAIEMCYNAAYSVSQIKGSKEMKAEAIEIFKYLRFWKLAQGAEQLIQNKAVTISKYVFDKYLEGNISRDEVRDVYLIANYIIHNSLYSCLKQYFGHYFNRPFSASYYLDIYQESEAVKEECNLCDINSFMCEETELFFKNFIGAGQHISEKEWKKVKDRHFRDMYKEL